MSHHHCGHNMTFLMHDKFAPIFEDLFSTKSETNLRRRDVAQDVTHTDSVNGGSFVRVMTKYTQSLLHPSNSATLIELSYPHSE